MTAANILVSTAVVLLLASCTSPVKKAMDKVEQQNAICRGDATTSQEAMHARNRYPERLADTVVGQKAKACDVQQLMARYEELVSLWIEKGKQYPPEAIADKMQGETVVRIRIDRLGNIRYYILERSTGYKVLDRAAVEMVKRANPLPAVPSEYPPGDLIEFKIPVRFHLREW